MAVMIYEVKSGVRKNADTLKTKSHFYWNPDKFKNLTIQDTVFVVNKHSGWILRIELENHRFSANYNVTNNTTNFTDNIIQPNITINGIDGKWAEFIRFKIIDEIKPQNFEWKSLGTGEITYIDGVNVNRSIRLNSVRIDQLDKMFKGCSNYTAIQTILMNSKSNFISPQSNPLPINNSNNYNYELKVIKTKPFVLLAGVSGTGKSRLVRTLAYKSCNNAKLRTNIQKPGNFELIPVRPNWHDSSELMGYISRINGEKYISTTFLQFIAKAWRYPDTPFFLCLDEMNLAPVEQYFAEYLSIIETRRNIGGKVVTDFIITKSSFENEKLYTDLLDTLKLDYEKFKDGISIPENLIVMGTVNMDETTYSFSRKVLDRAMTIEMNEVDLHNGLGLNTNDWEYPTKFLALTDVIAKYTAGKEVYNIKQFTNYKRIVLLFLEGLNKEALNGTDFKIAYRVRDEFLIYCYHSMNPQNKNWLDEALDEMTIMKILPKIEGDENRTKKVLRNLKGSLNNRGNYKKSIAKIEEMESRLELSGYTSFWS